MYELIQISKLNDFLFCPYSIYLHSIYDSFKKGTYQQRPQIEGTIAHDAIDWKRYSSSKHILQGLPIFCEKYKLVGKLDLFDTQKCNLIERKKQVKYIYDGYRYQLYGEYFCLVEAGYKVKKMTLRSLTTNQSFEIEIPKRKDILEFEELLEKIWEFDAEKDSVRVNKLKCQNCIYRQLCEYAKC